MNVTELINEIYNSKYVKTALKRAEKLIDLEMEVTDSVIFFLGNYMPKIQKYVKHEHKKFVGCYENVPVRESIACIDTESTSTANRSSFRNERHWTTNGVNSPATTEMRCETMDDKPIDRRKHDSDISNTKEQNTIGNSKLPGFISDRFKQIEDGIHAQNRIVEKQQGVIEKQHGIVEEQHGIVEEQHGIVESVCESAIGLIDAIQYGLRNDVEFNVEGATGRIPKKINPETIDVSSEVM